MSIGSRIIQIRNQKGISQRELSQRSAIASSYLSRIENRRLEPRPKTLRKIAKALSVPMSELFEEGPLSQRTVKCAISVSGNCIMDMLHSRRRKAPSLGIETYSPRQLQLLRMAGYLIQSGNTRLLETLETLLGALLSTVGSKRQAKSLVSLTPKSEPPSPLA